jgi:anti-sigma factor RsiW
MQPMNPCEDSRLQIFLYLDDELRDGELEAFEAHLSACEACRIAVDEERRFLNDIHSIRPLYNAPLALRSRVESILQGTPNPVPRTGFRLRLREMIQHVLVPVRIGWWPLPRAVPAFLLLAAVIAVLIGPAMFRASSPHSEFAAMAARLHERHLRGRLPLELHSSSADEISHWFNGKVHFQVKLPSYDKVSIQRQPYQYEGARLVSYHNLPAAYVAYQTGGKPVSFVALPTSMAPPLRGRAITMKSLTVYYDTVDNFHVITWSGPRSHLTYAVVTELEHPSQSCIICHAGPTTKDRDLMRTLNQQ